ncbi:hypothetical protein BEWA_004750 [Theileria equi strain WA]|uniref:Fibrinogen C-terminal domain-containing protein n=1 Tax=Theileria equi strain WA TaxID=1537102 RepID=L0AZP1_THEEQ|nr:hypothetical protein BEWA_004750 [Theileria equi strain WA]AFZ81067.1 hypothetical protein BEWA_004750 [Theileria equi strain WA]|eukprot:XP_004830733.1 hypothetical protein BEWA_004750 [Theileria equi strain WA]
MKIWSKYVNILLFCAAVSNVRCIWYLDTPTEGKGGEKAKDSNALEKPKTAVKTANPATNGGNRVSQSNAIDKVLLGGYSAKADSTYKAVESGGFRKYDANNALTKGGGYWCSERNLLDDRIVTWTGTLKVDRVLRGVIITWEYVPAFVSIWVSKDDTGEFIEIIPFQSCSNVTDKHEILFPRKVRTRSVQIKMKGQVNDYFGISFVQFIGEENPLFRIQSGITSIEDMCLQVDDTGEVVLDSCISAIANLTFGDVWRYNDKKQLYNPVTNLCMTLENNIETDGGRIMMLPCTEKNGDDYNDGRNSWVLLPNNQIKLRRPGNLCLSQHGSSAGLVNVALNKIAKSNYSVHNDPNHTAERALDGSAVSFWLSRHFNPDTIPEVNFTVNLQEEYKVRKVEIIWHIPALSYKLYIKHGDADWELVKDVSANTLKVTIDDMKDRILQFLRIEMISPNPDYSENGKLRYGINSISVYTNRLKTIVESCDVAKETKDARDKYFLESVYQVNLQTTLPLKRAEDHIESMVKTIEKKVADIERLTPTIRKCKTRHESYFNRIEQLKKRYEKFADKLFQIEQNMASVKVDDGITKSDIPRDCIDIKNLAENKPSGFYDIRPPCSPQPIRVYCDMYTGSSYYIATFEDSNSIGLPDVVNLCESHGLEPLQLQHEKQLESLRIMMNTMEIPTDTVLPLAVRIGHVFKSLDLAADVTSFLKPNDTDGNIVGITTDGVIYFDGRDKDMSGVICSSNYNSLRLPDEIPYIGCGAVVAENPKFSSTPGSKYKVQCPDDCLEIATEPYRVQGGKDGKYSLSSSICLAAIHSGEYDRLSPLEIEIIVAPQELDGFYQNGIDSESVPTILGDSAFKIRRLPKKCKNGYGTKTISQNMAKLSKGITTPSTNDQNSQSRDKEEVKQKEGTKYNKDLEHDKRPIDMFTGEAIESLIRQTYARTSKGSPVFLNLFHEHTGLVLANIRDLIKKADLSKIPSDTLLYQLDVKVRNFQNKIQLLASHVSYRRQALMQQMDKLNKEKASQTSFESWSMGDMGQAPIFKVFVQETSNGTKGRPSWTTSELNVRGTTELTISQMSEILPPNNIVGGTYLFLRNRKFYDFIFSAALYAGSSGTIGLAFRIVDMDNYYLFQMKQANGGYKRLIRVTDGAPYEIARIEDGGYIEEVWYTVRIETRQSRLMISVLQGDDPVFDTPKAVIDVIDATHMSGSVGLYTGKVSYGHFKRVHVDALACLRYDAPPIPPPPPFCSIYKEEYNSTFASNWSVYNSRGEWKYERDIMGESHAIAHIWKKGVEDEVEPTISVLKNHKSCSFGTFRASILPQCNFGSVGVVVRFHNAGEYIMLQLSDGYAVLKQMYKNNLVTLAETKVKAVALGSWNHVLVSFNDNSLTVSVGTDYDYLEVLFLNVRTSYEIEKGGSVGLVSLNCAACAFANITLKPIYTTGTDVTETLKRHTEEEETTLSYCRNIDRRSDCKNIASDNIDNCESNYCNVCCQFHYNDKEAQERCHDECEKLDTNVVLLQKAVDQLWFNCSNSEFMEQFGGCTESSCKQQACSLCCGSAKPFEFLSSSLNALAAKRCRKMCEFA